MRILFTFACLLMATLGLAHAPAWKIKNPFEHKCYVENMGQYEVPKEFADQTILFGARSQGTSYFITPRGILVMNTQLTEFSRKEKKLFQKHFDADEEERMKPVKRYEFIEFANASATPEIVKGTQAQNYYTYNDPADKTARKTIRATAYQTITLLNVYPDIDVLFEFLPDTAGIKYSFIVRPGGDPNNIALRFSNNTKVSQDASGNIISKGPAADLVHHKPESFTQNDHQKLASEYVLHNNTVNFKVAKYKAGQTVVIDPWTASTTFTGGPNAFDVDYDSQGNVYIHGGEDMSSVNCGLCKYSPSGTLLWTFYPSWGFNGGFGGYYGDFAIDLTSGSIYIVEGFNGSGAEVIKLNPAGSIMASFSGNPQFIEMWRISFSHCSNSAVIAGGGTSNPTYQTSYLDSNLTNLVMVQYITTTNCCHDVNCLALDNYGNCYQMTNNSSAGDGLFNNQLIKLPLPALNPPIYNVNDGFAWNEAASITFYHIMNNGYNGLTTSNTNVYTYDGYALRKWDGATGNLLLYKRVSYPSGGDSTLTYWGGLTSDDCDHIFLGDNTNVRQYDGNLNLVNTFPATGTIFDVRLGLNNGNIYVSGAGFVQTFTTSLSPCNFTALNYSTSITQPVCNVSTTGSATVTVSSGTPPFTIVWGTTPPQTGSVVTNVPPGTYTVSVTDNSCQHLQRIDTITVISTASFTSTPTVTQINCNGANNGAISITNTGATPPVTYTWSTGASGSSISGLGPGTYTVGVNDASPCGNTLSIVITEPLPITYNVTNDTIKCKGDTTSISVVTAGGTAPYSVVWNTTPVQTGATLPGVVAGNYPFTITDTNGCVKTGTANVVEGNTTISASTNANSDCAGGSNGSITLSITGGVPPYGISWSTNPVQTTATATGLPPGIYTATVTDNFGCVKTYKDTVKAFIPFTNTFTSVKPCAGGTNGSITASTTGGSGGPLIYQWNNNPSSNTNQVTQVPAGSYTLTVTNGNCNKTYMYNLVDKAPVDSLVLTAKHCVGETNVSINLPDSVGTPYQWYNGTSAAGNSSSVSVPYASIQNYTATWYHNGCRYITTQLVETILQSVDNLAPVNIFTPNADGFNDVFYPFEFKNATAFTDLSKVTESYSLHVFNRWGKLLFESTDITVGWNGKTDGGADLPDGVYYWIMKSKSSCGTVTETELKGFVHLAR